MPSTAPSLRDSDMEASSPGPVSPPTARSNDWILWQLADSAFPTGGFAHSGGVEAAWQYGELRNTRELESWIQAALVQAGRSMLPLMLGAFDRTSDFPEINALCDAFLTNHVANRASRLQGQALLASSARIFSQSISTWDADALCHFAPAFGRVARALEIERDQADRMFLFWHLRGWLAGAVRLGLTGPLEAQAMQARLAGFAEDVLRQSGQTDLGDIAQTAPMLDLWQSAQDRLYSRLF